MGLALARISASVGSPRGPLTLTGFLAAVRQMGQLGTGCGRGCGRASQRAWRRRRLGQTLPPAEESVVKEENEDEEDEGRDASPSPRPPSHTRMQFVPNLCPHPSVAHPSSTPSGFRTPTGSWQIGQSSSSGGGDGGGTVLTPTLAAEHSAFSASGRDVDGVGTSAGCVRLDDDEG